ncbi:hypothetical protein TSMEX_007778 [Taenia solium]|eukprot:TsM_000104800 transcript=TsM_000104800 gene=TsM_000104800
MWMRGSGEATALSLASPRLASPRLASPRLASPRLASPHLDLYQVSQRQVFQLLYRRVGRSRSTTAFLLLVPNSRDAPFLTSLFTHLTFLLFVALLTRLCTLFLITSTFTLGSTHHHLQLHVHLLFCFPRFLT